MTLLDQIVGRVAQSAARAVGTEPEGPQPFSGTLPLPKGYCPGQTLAAGTLVQGMVTIEVPVGAFPPYVIPDPRSRPRRTLAFQRIYLPVTVEHSANTGGKAAANALFQLTLQDGTVTLWQYEAEIPMQADPTGGFSTGNALVTDDFVNPVAVSPWQSPTLYYAYSFDQPANNCVAHVGAQRPFVTAPAPVNAPGVVHYQTLD